MFKRYQVTLHFKIYLKTIKFDSNFMNKSYWNVNCMNTNINLHKSQWVKNCRSVWPESEGKLIGIPRCVEVLSYISLDFGVGYTVSENWI